MAADPTGAPAAPSPLRRPLMVAGAVVLLAAIAIHLAQQADDVRQLSRLSPAVLTGSLLLLFAAHLAHNESMLVPLRVYLPRLGFWELFLVRTGGLVLGSAVPVAGGLVVRLAYLARQGLTPRDFAYATLLSNVLALAAAAGLALPATAVFWARAGTLSAAALGLTLGILALSVAAVAVLQALPRLTQSRRLPRWLAAAEGRTADPAVVRRTLIASVLRHAASFAAFGWLYAALSGGPGSFVAGGLVYALTTPIRMVALTPGNLGVNEWAAAVVGRALTFDLTTGLLVSGVFRVASLAAQGGGVLAGWAFGGGSAGPARRS